FNSARQDPQGQNRASLPRRREVSRELQVEKCVDDGGRDRYPGRSLPADTARQWQRERRKQAVFIGPTKRIAMCTAGEMSAFGVTPERRTTIRCRWTCRIRLLRSAARPARGIIWMLWRIGLRYDVCPESLFSGSARHSRLAAEPIRLC